MNTPIIDVIDLVKDYPVRKGVFGRTWFRAVDGVSFSLRAGETLAIVGESGSGKSTIAKCILGLERPSSGRILLDGQDVTALSYAELRILRHKMQMVFQDPLGSLNPRLRVGAMIGEPLWLFGTCSRRDAFRRAAEVLEEVQLDSDQAVRFPHQLSGGQQQRVGIARAIAAKPRLVVLDEPTSSLDVSVQAGILSLLRNLQAQLGSAYLFISHDLSVVASLSTRVAVMHSGKIVEMETTERVFREPAHHYTKRLLAAVPATHPRNRKAYKLPFDGNPS